MLAALLNRYAVTYGFRLAIWNDEFRTMIFGAEAHWHCHNTDYGDPDPAEHGNHRSDRQTSAMQLGWRDYKGIASVDQTTVRPSRTPRILIPSAMGAAETVRYPSMTTIRRCEICIGTNAVKLGGMTVSSGQQEKRKLKKLHGFNSCGHGHRFFAHPRGSYKMGLA